MTDIKKIIEDLEYARYHCTSNKGKDAINDALDLINRQQAEIEELNELYTNLKNASVQHCVDNEKDRQLLGEYQNIFLELGYSTEVFDPELTEIKAWKDRMIWNCKKSN